MKLISLMILLSSVSFGSTLSLSQFPEIDTNKMHDKDVFDEKLGNAPRFAVERFVSISPLLSSDWKKSGSKLIWSHRVKAVNAVSLNFAFKKFNLPKSAKLNIFATDLSDTVRTFTSADNNSANELWTPVVMSDDVTIEVTIDLSEVASLELELSQVNQGYRTFAQTTQKSGSCNVDVVCSEGNDWKNEINSVGVISTGGSTFCTGFMVNNTSNDKTPYFMTAKHCRINESNAASLVVYWNFQASNCGGARNGKQKEFNTGSTFLSASSKSDFTLVKLNQSPKAQWNVTYAGWDATGVDASSATAIHHPATDEKSISFENDPTTVTAYLGSEIPGDGTHVRVENWDVGTTEPGSSGSPLFNQDHRVIGQLHGGYASCTSATSDWYGRLSSSWEGDGSSSTRLRDHLDSANTGSMVTDTLR